MVPSSKTTHRFLIGGSFKKAPRFAMKRAPHVELRVAPQRTPHRLDFGLAELVRPVALRRSCGKRPTSAAACAKAKKAASGTGSSTTIAKFRSTDSGAA